LFRLLLLPPKPPLMEMTQCRQLPPALHQLQIVEKNITDTFFLQQQAYLSQQTLEVSDLWSMITEIHSL
jgi:hypothetical protein